MSSLEHVAAELRLRIQPKRHRPYVVELCQTLRQDLSGLLALLSLLHALRQQQSRF